MSAKMSVSLDFRVAKLTFSLWPAVGTVIDLTALFTKRIIKIQHNEQDHRN